MFEALIEFIFEFIGEVFIQIIVEIGLEFGFESFKEKFKRPKAVNPFISITGLLILGSFLGLISACVFPYRIFPQYKMTGFSIIISPIVAGLILHFFGNWRRNRYKNPSSLASFWGGFSFAFALTFVRWLILKNSLY